MIKTDNLLPVSGYPLIGY